MQVGGWIVHSLQQDGVLVERGFRPDRTAPDSDPTGPDNPTTRAQIVLDPKLDGESDFQRIGRGLFNLGYKTSGK